MSEDLRCPHSGDSHAARTIALAVGPSLVVLGVTMLPPISPFKYIVDFNVQYLLFFLSLYSNNELQCHFTEKKNVRSPNELKGAEADRCSSGVVWGWGTAGSAAWSKDSHRQFIVLLNDQF